MRGRRECTMVALLFLALPHAGKHGLSIWPSNSIPRYRPEGAASICPPGTVQECSQQHYSEEPQGDNDPRDRLGPRMGEQDVV